MHVTFHAEYEHLHLISFCVLDYEIAPKIELYFSQYVEK